MLSDLDLLTQKGITARIVEGGAIRVGDAVQVA